MSDNNPSINEIPPPQWAGYNPRPENSAPRPDPTPNPPSPNNSGK